MTAHNPAMSFWPLERQLIDGTTPSDQDCREMLLEVRRLSAIERAASDDTAAAVARVRAGVHSRIYDVAEANALGNIAHAEAYVPGYARIADAKRDAQREGR